MTHLSPLALFAALAVLALPMCWQTLHGFVWWWRALRKQRADRDRPVWLPTQSRALLGPKPFDPLPGAMIFWNLIYLVVLIAIQIAIFLLTPKPKGPQPDSTKDLQDPVAEAGKPVPVIFGTMTMKGLNALGYWDKRKIKYKVSPP